jgi:hypothetical protein
MYLLHHLTEKKTQAFEEKLCDVSSSHGGEYEGISTV